MRSLIQSGDTYILGRLDEYREIPKEYFHNSTSVIYADKVATMILDPMTASDFSAVIISNPHIAAAQRNLFNLIWVNTTRPKKSTASNRYKDVCS